MGINTFLLNGKSVATSQTPETFITSCDLIRLCAAHNATSSTLYLAWQPYSSSGGGGHSCPLPQI